MYDYRARITKVVDGDTVHVDWDLGRDIHVNDTIRLYGIDTPEMGTPEGVAAKEAVYNWLALVNPFADYCVVGLQTIKDKREKYGRYLGIIYDPNEPNNKLNDYLLENGFARVYNP